VALHQAAVAVAAEHRAIEAAIGPGAADNCPGPDRNPLEVPTCRTYPPPAPRPRRPPEAAVAALEPETARALLGLARDATTLRARLVDLLDAFDGIGAGQRPARPGEVCTCGDPAVVVYETARFGDVGHCGVEHVGSFR
jgi:hypothetical protein